MAALGPFEPGPRIAVAVSGGADSLALCLLTHDWARRLGGSAVALTVDHGLRPGSAEEARQVRSWLRKHGIRHHILAWAGPRPGTGIQAAARAARYELLTGWCRERGVLHLALAHNLEDQAETFLLRLARGSGVDGLSAMAPVVEGPAVRLLRPLLGMARARLAATLRARGQTWIEDPSNSDLAFSRVRVRKLLPGLAREGLSVTRLAATARRMGRARTAFESATADVLARAAMIAPAGYGYLDGEALADAETEVGLRALARILMCIGGRVYPPRLERLERLHAAVVTGPLAHARTLCGCRILARGPGPARLLICREAAAAGQRLPVTPGTLVTWDGRFRVAFGADRKGPGKRGRAPRLALARLGRAGWAEVAAANRELRRTTIPAAARPSLPALWDGRGVVAVPHLEYQRAGAGAKARVVGIALAPPIPLTAPGFSVA